MKLNCFFYALSALLFLSCVNGASSTAVGAILDLSNLPPGTPYRLIFVTFGRIDGTSSNISVYNDFVTSQANMSAELAALGTTWTALASTTTTNAQVNTGTAPSADPLNPIGELIVTLDGRIVANNYNDLWDGDLDDVIEMTQFGDRFPYHVWSGTKADGSTAVGLELGNTINNYILKGSSSTTTAAWMDLNFVDSKINTANVYAISERMTVAVPEPGTLIALSFVAPFIYWKRRKHPEQLHDSM